MPQAGYVYVLHGVGTNYIKVGKSTNLQQRIQTLQQGVPFVLQLLSAQLVHDADAGENALKALYAPYKTRGEEWFALPETLLRQWPIDTPVRSFVPPEQDKPSPNPRTHALDWLEVYLQGGSKPTLTILAAAAAVGIREKTLRRARRKANVEVVRVGNAWHWQLASSPANPLALPTLAEQPWFPLPEVEETL